MPMFKDLVKSSRSYRGYDESYKFTMEQILSYLDTAARYTPSGTNNQPLKFHIAIEKEELGKIQAVTRWGAALPQLKLPYEGKRPTAFVVIFHDKNITPNREMALIDLGIVAQTLILSAAEDGLGGCMIMNFKKDALKEVLNPADNLDPLLVVALGKPDEKIVIVDAPVKDGSTKYYRDENDVHYVPKRKLEDILV